MHSRLSWIAYGLPRRMVQLDVTKLIHSSSWRTSADSSSPSDIIEFEKDVSLNHVSQNPLLPVQDATELASAVPQYVPSFNLAAYVNKSPLLQEFVKLGVELHKWDRRGGVAPLVLGKDFEADIKPVIRFLIDNRVRPEMLGKFLSKNPLIFRETLDDLQVRVNYLQAKKFSKQQIGEILEKNPNWLLFSTERIDNRLGFFQKTFHLKGPEVRAVAIAAPKLVTWSLWRVKMMNFSFKEEMGLTDEQMKQLIVKRPGLWISDREFVKKAFDIANNQMKLSHETIVRFPQILECREFRLKQRHLYLQSLNRNQYDPTLENYVSPLVIISGTDAEFCENVAKTSVKQFNDFLKTL